MRAVTDQDIPELEHHEASWVVIRKEDGHVLGEFTNRKTLYRFNADKVQVKTIVQHLASLNG